MPCTEAYKEHIMYTFNGSCKRKWRRFYIGNPNLLPYETIVRATSGETEAVEERLSVIVKLERGVFGG